MGITALFGASGSTGKSTADALRFAGKPYRVVGRDREKLQAEFGGDELAEIVTWNPDDAASVRAAARGVETLIYVVGVPYERFHLHPMLMDKTLVGAIAEGVEKVVLIGSVYSYGLPQSQLVTEEHSREPQTYKGKLRKAQEDAVLKAHKEGKIKATILRLPDFYGPGIDKSLLHGAFKAAAQGGIADVVGPLDTPHEFVYIPDVGPVVLALAAKSEAYGKAWNLAGAGVTSQKQMVDWAFAVTQRKMRLRVFGVTMLRLVGLFNPIMRELVEMQYLQTNPVLLDDSALLALLGDVKKTPYEQGVRECVRALKING